jgi:hypothetical protein
MSSTDRERWARVPPHLAWKRPGLPTEWTLVLERNPEAMNPEPLPGYVWLELPGKMLHAREADLEFRLTASVNNHATEWTDMPGDNLQSEVEWLAGQLSASLVRYERGLATRLQQFLEISPDLRRDFARTHFTTQI